MAPSTIRLEREARGVARLTLARPERHNALDGAMIADLTGAARDLAQDGACRAVVLAAEGASFCAGGDLGWMRAQFDAERGSRAREARALADMLAALAALPMPLLAAVQGPAYGGGVGVLALCDLAVGAEGAVFAMTETRLGLIPATISPYVLARIGAPACLRLMLPSRRFDAAEALSLGLLAKVVPAADLDAAVEAELALLLACAPGAVRATKRLLRTLAPLPDAATVDHTIGALVERWESEETRGGVAAFLDRRAPPWRAEEGER